MIVEEHEAHAHHVLQKRVCRSAWRFVSSGKLQISNRRRFESSKLCDLTGHPPNNPAAGPDVSRFYEVGTVPS